MMMMMMMMMMRHILLFWELAIQQSHASKLQRCPERLVRKDLKAEKLPIPMQEGFAHQTCRAEGKKFHKKTFKFNKIPDFYKRPL